MGTLVGGRTLEKREVYIRARQAHCSAVPKRQIQALVDADEDAKNDEQC